MHFLITVSVHILLEEMQNSEKIYIYIYILAIELDSKAKQSKDRVSHATCSTASYARVSGFYSCCLQEILESSESKSNGSLCFETSVVFTVYSTEVRSYRITDCIVYCIQ